MNGAEATQVLTVMQAAWRTRWTEAQEDFWLFELLQFEANDAQEAVRRLATQIDHAPSLHQFIEAIGAIRVERHHREEAARRALTPAQAERKVAQATQLSFLREVRRAMRGENDLRHDHHRGAERCPVCSKHDHSNVTAFGFTRTTQRGEQPDREGIVHTVEHSTPVPGWHFDCPACGDPERAQHACTSWTQEGVAWMRQWRAA